MIYKGLFQVTSLTNTKYIWQYRITHDISGSEIYNVIRPLISASGKRFWEFYTHTIKKDACNLRLNKRSAEFRANNQNFRMCRSGWNYIIRKKMC